MKKLTIYSGYRIKNNRTNLLMYVGHSNLMELVEFLDEIDVQIEDFILYKVFDFEWFLETFPDNPYNDVKETNLAGLFSDEDFPIVVRVVKQILCDNLSTKIDIPTPSLN